MKTPESKPMDMATVSLRLFTIRNIANLAAYLPENKAEAYILQDVVDHISNMVQDLIEEIGV